MDIKQAPIFDVSEDDKNAVLERVASWFWSEWYPRHRRDVIFRLPFRPIRVYDGRAVFIQLFGEPNGLPL